MKLPPGALMVQARHQFISVTMRTKIRSLAQIIAVFLFIAVNMHPALCQQRPDPGATERERERELNERELEERMLNLRLLSLRARKTTRPEEMKLALDQLQEDFTRIQMLNTALARAALGTSPLELKFVSKSLAEIKKRSERLHRNLALPEPDRSLERPPFAMVTDPAKMKEALLELGYLIVGFVDNPFFKEANVLDAQLTVKARADLERIIKLSDYLKKTSEELQKTPRKSR